MQQTPPDHRGGYDLAMDTVVVSGETYDDAYSAAEAKIPDGWRMISVRRI